MTNLAPDAQASFTNQKTMNRGFSDRQMITNQFTKSDNGIEIAQQR